MSEGTCAYCGATLEPGAVFCIACGARVAPAAAAVDVPAPSYDPPVATYTPPTAPSESAMAESAAWAPYDPEGKTVVAEDEGMPNVADCVPAPVPAPITYAIGEPAATIIEEPEPVPASIRLEIADAESGDQNVEFDLDEGASFTLGRDGRVTNYVPEDPRASRRHFSISVAPEGLYLTDLGSSNGTYVNGTRVTESVWLKDGDKVEYGRSSAIVRILRMPELASSGSGGVIYL